MKSSTKIKLKVGKISYLNCLPYYFGWADTEAFDFHFKESYPQVINRAMCDGALDIAPVSSLEYLNHQDQYLILPEHAIASNRFAESVLLFSKSKLEQLEGQEIAVTKESLSSSTLLKILLLLKFGMKNRYAEMESNPKKMLESFQGALVIGDDALFYEPDQFIYKYDLGELWWNWTQKPFCFALWVVHRKFAQDNPEEVSAFCALLKHHRTHNLQNLETLIRDGFGMSPLDQNFSKVLGYFSNLNYDLEKKTLEGLNLFYHYAHEAGLAPKSKPLELFQPTMAL